ncbi:MAG: rhamnulokinase [Luteolibacter sp.]
MSERNFIACDLGAESGRVILGNLSGGKLTYDELHRFPTGATRIGGSLRWNILRIFEELKKGLRKVADTEKPVASVSVDSWGVDYVLFNAKQPMLAIPHQYRDSRTDKVYNAAIEKAGAEKIFSETGLQFMSINTLFQLVSEVQENPELLDIADNFLTIADYVNYLFSGAVKEEQSLASTTQVYNPVTQDWSKELIDVFGFPEKIFPEIVPSGTVIGKLLPELQDETKLSEIDVVASCSHDTGAAVAAVPAEGEDWAFLSSGTWSLIGVELPSPLINEDVRAHNFTNEGGFGGTTRFLKNIVGLWLLQESRRAWTNAGKEFEYATIMKMAEESEPFRSLIDPRDPRFVAPSDMPEAIASYCRESGQVEPETPGQIARCVLESLALLYHGMLGEIEELTGRTINRLHIVGGGSQGKLLNQLAANATGRTVFAGPVEATAIGNILIQAVALGDLDSLGALRDVVKASFPIDKYEPQEQVKWQEAIARFENLKISQ